MTADSVAVWRSPGAHRSDVHSPFASRMRRRAAADRSLLEQLRLQDVVLKLCGLGGMPRRATCVATSRRACQESGREVAAKIAQATA